MLCDITLLLCIVAGLVCMGAMGTSPALEPVSRCPFGCDCRHANRIHCSGRLWKRIPILPSGTASLVIDEAVLPELTVKSFQEKNCERLRKLTITRSYLAKIEVHTFKATPNIQTLHLHNNHLTDLNQVSLSRMNTVSYLDISHNHLQSFPEAFLCQMHNLRRMVLGKNSFANVSFQGSCWRNMHHLNSVYLNLTDMSHASGDTWAGFQWSRIEVLSLENCSIHTLADNFFFHMKDLLEINLRRNNLTVLSHTTFSYLTRMERLFISYNWFTAMDFLTWRHSPNLSILDIGSKYFNFEDISFSELSFYSNLTYLYIRFSNFKRIDDQFLSIGNNSRLKCVLIEFCGLRYIKKGAFQGLRELESLKFPSNRLIATSVYNLTFGLSHTVRIFNFHKNLLQTLPDTLFAGLLANSSLESVQMSLCDITGVLPLSAFKVVPNITRLDFYKNQIQSVLPYTLHTVHYIDMSHNSIQQLKAEFMCSFPNLVALDLSWNIMDQKIPKNIANCTKHLEVLILQRCNIVNLASFNLFPNLRSLSLSNNGIINIDSINTLKLQSLTSLDISANIIRHSLPSNMFSNFRNLSMLNVSYLRLARISPSFFRPLVNLKSLDISMATLENIHVNLFSSATFLEHIKFTGNPLMCTCEMLPFFRFLHKNNIFAEGITKIHPFHTTCLQSGVTIDFLDFSLTEQYCSPDREAVQIIISFIISCAAIVISSTVYRYRWYLKYGCYNIKRNVYNYYSSKNNSIYQFDAFVSCSSHDLPWVLEEMVPAVETRQNKKLCIYSRNWLAGKKIVDYIIHSIDASRRVVLVVTNSFAKSTWCGDEMQLAR